MALRAVAEINLAAIERNAERLIAGLSPGARLCAVVKADGYGHGTVAAARAAMQAGAADLAVATANEAARLRAAGIETPILILGALSDEEVPVALAAGATVTVWDSGFVEVLALAARREGVQVPVHVKLDTGLGRLGTRDPEQAMEVARAVKAAAPGLLLRGAMTHFATAESDQDFVNRQLAAFAPFVTQIRALAADGDFTVHAANSAATILSPHSHYDMVRTGIALYGCDPMNRDPAEQGLEPALTLRSYVAALKLTRPGESIGYGRHFIAERDTYVATLPIGYADGVPRALANNLDVLIDGNRYPLCGMVSMDNVTVDVGPEPNLRTGQQVTIIGLDGGSRQTAEQVSHRLGTINYEVLCGISARVPRVYHRDGEPV